MKAFFNHAIGRFRVLKAAACGLGAGLLLAGCTKTADGPAPPAAGAGTGTGGGQSAVTATVSGAADFAASGFNNIDGLYYTDSDPASSPARLIMRARSAGREITFSLIHFTGPGTYTLKADPNATIGTGVGSYSEGNNASVYFTQYQTPAGAVQGQVVLTTYDKASKHMQGTFSFNTVGITGSIKGQSKQVSSGKFDVYDVFLY